MGKKQAKKQERIRQFTYPRDGGFAYTSFSGDLLRSARTLLNAALMDRLQYSANTHTHASAHGAGAIVLAVTAFDVWLSEMILGLVLPEKEVRDQLARSTLNRYGFLQSRYEITSGLDISDLETVVSIRDEIVHHFPRPDKSMVPAWYPSLQARGLLITHPLAPKEDFSLTQKLTSYGLAYWIFEVLEAAVRHLQKTPMSGRAYILSGHVHNFGLYREICPPKHLRYFDRRLGLKDPPQLPRQD